MSSRLEQFIKDNRDGFDSDEPSPKVWGKIEGKIMADKKGAAPIVRMNFLRWSAAATVAILVTGGVWFLVRTKTNSSKPLAQNQSSQPTNPKTNDLGDTSKSYPITKQQLAAADKSGETESKGSDVIADPQKDAKEEMYHFAKLVEIKQRELKSIEKEEPLLYKQFSADVNKLDSVYHSLENELATKQNSEELLEAMIQNLQLQMGLLNHQLRIIKQINHSKKSAYDKAYQSI
jgi:hypothetical protein